MYAKRLLVFILLMAIFTASAQAATVRGTIYAWSDFEEPLKNAILEVSSTPVQSKVATDGTYLFELPQGNYMLKARYYQNNVLEYTADEEIQIGSEGNFTIDLLLFPPTESEYESLGDINLTDIKQEDNLGYIILILIIFSAGTVLYWLKKKATKPAEKALPLKAELPEDLKDIYELILKKGGRTTQKELRKELRSSEAKVSLMIADLEDRGLVKKIKKGRANIIIVKS